MSDAFDLVVIGGGVVGLSTAWYAGKCGKQTLLLEQNHVEVSSGSSRGSSRMFGEIFTEEIHYKIARQSRHFWRELELETGEELLYMNGGLDIYIGAGCERQAIEDASEMPQSSNLEVLTEKIFHARYPQWQCGKDVCAIYSELNGILRADLCLKSLVKTAKKYGTVFGDYCEVSDITRDGSDTLIIKTKTGQAYRARKVIIAAGPWAPEFLSRLGVKLPLKISQEQVVYFKLKSNFFSFAPELFPVWVASETESTSDRVVYGFPIFEKEGIKVAFHRDQRFLNNFREFNSSPDFGAIARVKQFLERHLPYVSGDSFDVTPCMYTSSPDNYFVMDTIPGNSSIAYFTADNGRAFHGGPAIGKMIVELVFEGKTELDRSKFLASRFKN